MVCSMHDLLIALLFIAFVASPAIVAALPVRERDEQPESSTKEIDLPATRSLSTTR